MVFLREPSCMKDLWADHENHTPFLMVLPCRRVNHLLKLNQLVGHFLGRSSFITYLDFCSSLSLGLPAFGLIYSSETKTDHVVYSHGSETKCRLPHMVLKACLRPHPPFQLSFLLFSHMYPVHQAYMTMSNSLSMPYSFSYCLCLCSSCNWIVFFPLIYLSKPFN